MIRLQKPTLATLYHFLCATFCIIVVISNIISAKMVHLPLVSLVIPAGLITYPLTFLISDLVTEIFGPKRAREMVYITLAMNLIALAIIQMALFLPAGEQESAFREVLGTSGLRIFSSLAAYITAQIIDIQIYALLKRWTGDRSLWLRNNGSTWSSQLIDTILIDIIFLYWGLGMAWKLVFPIMVLSYLYKIIFALFTTPLFYLLVYFVKRHWGHEIYERKSV